MKELDKREEETNK